MPEIEADQVFRALGDPTRRALLELLLDGECAQQDLHPHFDLTQPALSQHLRVLREAGLVEQERDGRRQIYRLSESGFDPLVDWMGAFQEFWGGRLLALGDYLRRNA